jgi:MFS family permease
MRRRGLTLGLFAQWVGATVIGALVGQVLAQWLAGALLLDFREANVFSFLVGVLAGAVMGACIGIAQGAALARRFGTLGWRDWVVASVVGGALRWAIVSPILSTLLTIRTGWRGSSDETDVCIFFLALILFAIVSGLAFGIPQAVVLRNRVGQVSELDGPAWSLANSAGALLTIPIISLSGWNIASAAIMAGVAAGDITDKTIYVTLITWLFIGLATAVPLNDRLKAEPE